jgi:hypothetical protein
MSTIPSERDEFLNALEVLRGYWRPEADATRLREAYETLRFFRSKWLQTALLYVGGFNVLFWIAAATAAAWHPIVVVPASIVFIAGWFAAVQAAIAVYERTYRIKHQEIEDCAYVLSQVRRLAPRLFKERGRNGSSTAAGATGSKGERA